MTPAARISELGGNLGTLEGLAKVNAAIEFLNRDLMNSNATFSRDELAQTMQALNSLGATIICMDHISSAMLLHRGAVVNCVG